MFVVFCVGFCFTYDAIALTHCVTTSTRRVQSTLAHGRVGSLWLKGQEKVTFPNFYTDKTTGTNSPTVLPVFVWAVGTLLPPHPTPPPPPTPPRFVSTRTFTGMCIWIQIDVHNCIQVARGPGIHNQRIHCYKLMNRNFHSKDILKYHSCSFTPKYMCHLFKTHTAIANFFITALERRGLNPELFSMKIQQTKSETIMLCVYMSFCWNT